MRILFFEQKPMYRGFLRYIQGLVSLFQFTKYNMISTICWMTTED